jgi:hypothetical protein
VKSLIVPCLLLLGFCLCDSEGISQPDTGAPDTSCCQAVTIQRTTAMGDFTPAFGFRGYRFGTPHMRLNGLKMKSVHGRNTWYQVEGGLNIGRARISSMDFGFRDDRFYGVSALPADYRSFLELKTIIDSVYGPPFKVDSLQESVSYLWNVPDVVVKLRMYWGTHRVDDKGNEMILSMIATPILIDPGNSAPATPSSPAPSP